MFSPALRPVFAALLLLLFGGREFGLVMLDVGLYHRSAQSDDSPIGPHFDVTGGCHLDRCALVSLGSAPSGAVLDVAFDFVGLTIVGTYTPFVGLSDAGLSLYQPQSRSPPASSLI
jgi:hypothetical protein